MYLKKNLRFLRRSQGYSQSDFGDLVGVKGESISNYERGNSYPSIETISKAATIFKITIDDFIHKDFSTKKNQSTISRVEEPYTPCKNNCENELKICQIQLESKNQQLEILKKYNVAMEKQIVLLEQRVRELEK